LTGQARGSTYNPVKPKHRLHNSATVPPALLTASYLWHE
jgi:hypothetical protein